MVFFVSFLVRFICTSQPKSFDIVEWTEKHRKRFFLFSENFRYDLLVALRLKYMCSKWNQYLINIVLMLMKRNLFFD